MCLFITNFRSIASRFCYVMLIGHIAAIADDVTSGTEYNVYVVPAISKDYIYPDQVKINGDTNATIKFGVSPGEIVPASFVVTANKDLRLFEVISEDLIGQQGSIPATAVDIRVVKLWYQAGKAIFQTDQRILVSELLLKDDRLIKVDYDTKNNYLRNDNKLGVDPYILISGSADVDISLIAPQDSKTLQPTSLATRTNKQYWITLRTPDGALPGEYKGNLKLISADAKEQKIAIDVTVHPIRLESPALTYSLYYRGRLSQYAPGDPRLDDNHRDSKGILNSNFKTEDQYRAEMLNMKEHGVAYPTVYQSDKDQFIKEMIIRSEVGMPMDTLYSLGVQTGTNYTDAELLNLSMYVREWQNLAYRFEVQNFYVYGIDEAENEKLLAQRTAWNTVRKTGAKMFAAIHIGGVDMMGADLDTAIVPHEFNSDEVRKYHALGKKIFSYSNPQVGLEDPEIYRRNYGVALWRSGYDGVMDYAYQHSANHIWNDFDDTKYRDHVFAYPTVNGVIDTIAFEGFREAINDVRYLTTLLSAIKRADPNNNLEAKKAETWLQTFDPDGNLQDIRDRAIQWILALQEADTASPSPPDLRVSGTTTRRSSGSS